MKAPTNAALRLLTYAAITISAVSITWLAAKNRIEAQQTAAFLSTFRAISPTLDADDAFRASREAVTIAGSPGERYTAKDGSTYYRSHTDKGYNGNIPPRRTRVGRKSGSGTHAIEL